MIFEPERDFCDVGGGNGGRGKVGMVGGKHLRSVSEKERRMAAECGTDGVRFRSGSGGGSRSTVYSIGPLWTRSPPRVTEIVVPIVSIELIVHKQIDYIVVDVRHMVSKLETGRLLVSWLRKLRQRYETAYFQGSRLPCESLTQVQF